MFSRACFSATAFLAAFLVLAQVALASGYAPASVCLFSGVAATAGFLGFSALNFACEKAQPGAATTKSLVAAGGLLVAQSFVLGVAAALSERAYRRSLAGVAACAAGHLLVQGGAAVARLKIARETPYAEISL